MAEKLNTLSRNPFLVLDGGGNPVTGEAPGNFTVTAALDNVVIATPVASVVESIVGNGRYHLLFTPITAGFYEFKISHATYFPNGVFASFWASQANDTDIAKVLGLMGENYLIDNVVTTRGQVTAFRTRLFASKTLADAAVSGESGNDGLAKFQYTKTIDDTDSDNPETIKMTLEP